MLTLPQAKALREAQERNIALDFTEVCLPQPAAITAADAVLAAGEHDGVPYDIRLDGEENILVELGEMKLDIALRFRVHILMQRVEEAKLPLIDMTPGIRSLQVHFDCHQTDAVTVAREVGKLLCSLGNIDDITVPSRVVYLPLSWDDPQTQLARRRSSRRAAIRRRRAPMRRGARATLSSSAASTV